MGANAYLPSPGLCERLEAIVRRCHGAIVYQPVGSKTIEYALPQYATEELRDFLRTKFVGKLDPAFIARLPGGRVFGSGDVLSPDGKSIARDVSPDFGKPFEDHWLLTYRKISPPEILNGITAVIATTLGSGYSHWLLEELPRLLALETGQCSAIIAHAAQPYSREAITLHGFKGRIIDAKRYAHYSCAELLVPSLGQMTLPTIRALEEFTQPLQSERSLFGEKLYISREKSRRRRVTNEAELWVKLEAQGFQKLHLENHAWQQQIAAFRGAKVIVAPHGAGLANLVFCLRGTRVVEFFNRSYVNGCYWQLAALKKLDYRPVVNSGDEPLAETLSANRVDIPADLVRILRACSDA